MQEEYDIPEEEYAEEQQAPDAMSWDNAVLEDISIHTGQNGQYAKFKIRKAGSQSQYPTNMSWFYGEDPMAPALIQSLRKGMIATIYFSDTQKQGQYGMTTYHNIKAIIPTGAMALPQAPNNPVPKPTGAYLPQSRPIQQGFKSIARAPVQANSKDVYWESKAQADLIKDARISRHGCINTAVELMKLAGNKEELKADQLLQGAEALASIIQDWLNS